ncbi:MAG: hypothetical protein QM750_21470 [Rubrivivax sp.]
MGTRLVRGLWGIVLAMALDNAACAQPVIFNKLSPETYAPTRNVAVYWGSEIDTAPKDFVEIGTIFASWNGRWSTSFSVRMPPLLAGRPQQVELGQTDRPETPLPEIYLQKAREVGADALFVRSVTVIPITTPMPARGLLDLVLPGPSIDTTQILYQTSMFAVRFEKPKGLSAMARSQILRPCPDSSLEQIPYVPPSGSWQIEQAPYRAMCCQPDRRDFLGFADEKSCASTVVDAAKQCDAKLAQIPQDRAEQGADRPTRPEAMACFTELMDAKTSGYFSKLTRLLNQNRVKRN